jgi:hypothetical protein
MRKCLKETPCIVSYLKPTKIPFYKNGEQGDKTNLVWGLVLVGGEEDIRKV